MKPELASILSLLRERYQDTKKVNSILVKKKISVGYVFEVFHFDIEKELCDEIIKDAKPYAVWFKDLNKI